jgi:hypothetical protein
METRPTLYLFGEGQAKGSAVQNEAAILEFSLTRDQVHGRAAHEAGHEG